MFRVPLQHITVAELPHWMTIARAESAKFKAFSFPVIPYLCAKHGQTRGVWGHAPLGKFCFLTF